jgi:UDP-N-acetyl-alpha-D-muramoyl-L-alanyl-L-glutamate epimerase
MPRFNPADYREFIYRLHYISPDCTRFAARYALSGPGGTVEFTEVMTLPPGVLTGGARALARLLFLACGVSYYKSACPQRIRVEGGLCDEEHRFLGALIENGLAEFAYRNGFFQALRPSIDGSRRDRVGPVSNPRDADGQPLVPVGGGKDSVVTLESLRKIGAEPLAFSVNWSGRISACIDAGSYRSVHAARRLDRVLDNINACGAYDGHVPITSIISLVALLVAESMALGPVVMSNERSADDGNISWNGKAVNHQWSKSMEFETILRDYMLSLGMSPDRYFSLLRPLSEVAIAQRFARCPAYFRAFRSCNWQSERDTGVSRLRWCCECAKCHFVFLALAPFLDPPVLEEIFGCNLLDAAGRKETYDQLLGLGACKPFECVGTIGEARLAARLAGSNPAWRTGRLLRRLLAETEGDASTPADAEAAVLRVHDEHNVPARYTAALHALI